MMRRVLGGALALFLATHPATGAGADASVRALHVGIPRIAESLDPAREPDTYAWYLLAGVYDTLYVLDPVARPAALVPSAAVALPEVSADRRTFTIRVRPGIFFTPHPAFGGKPRELVAQDFAYSIKRLVDPKLRSPSRYLVEGRIEGLDALARRAADAGTALDYDAPVAGLEIVDRHTLRIRLTAPDSMFPFLLAVPVIAGVAREVIDKADGPQAPVGTGAFVVADFLPRERLVLMRNPGYREVHWEDWLTPASRAAAIGHPMRGRRLPAVARIEFTATPEPSAELLALRRGELDLVYSSAPELATADGRLKPELAKEGVELVRDPAPSARMYTFSMRDPVVGGQAREKIALRRAIAMAFDDEEWIRLFDAGFARVPEQLVPTAIEGHVPDYRNPNGFDPGAANALLDRVGYRLAADGYRRNPDGTPLAVPIMVGTSSEARKEAEFHKRMLDRIGLRIAFETVADSERIKRSLHCQYGMAYIAWAFDVPDGINIMSMFWGKAIGSVNASCFADPAFDAAYEKAQVEPPGPARMALFRTMQARLDALAPLRLRPARDNILLRRKGVLGPFPTIIDWLQVVTLSFDFPDGANPRR
jgi:ABC-type transport system substrate-binding protein